MVRKHWVLVDLERMLIEKLEFPKRFKLEKAVPHRPRWAQRLTGIRVRLYEPPLMWRHTLAVFYVVNKEYRNAAVYHFGLTEFLPVLVRDEMFVRLIQAVEADLGYGVDEFWFETEPHESVDRVPYRKGKTENCIVSDVFLKRGRRELTVFSLDYARKMIAEGKWFKGETLERWLPVVEA